MRTVVPAPPPQSELFYAISYLNHCTYEHEYLVFEQVKFTGVLDVKWFVGLPRVNMQVYVCGSWDTYVLTVGVKV